VVPGLRGGGALPGLAPLPGQQRVRSDQVSQYNYICGSWTEKGLSAIPVWDHLLGIQILILIRQNRIIFIIFVVRLVLVITSFF